MILMTKILPLSILFNIISSTNSFANTHKKSSYYSPKISPSLLTKSLSKNENSETYKTNEKISFDSLHDTTVLVVGGSGRVGGSVVTQLIKRGCNVIVGGTKEESFSSAQNRWIAMFPEYKTKLKAINFYKLNRENVDSVTKIIQEQSKIDLVVNTAGPFQGKVTTLNGVLVSCIQEKVPYIDVCDDYCTAMSAKTKYSNLAIENGIPCIISTGCWPGVSSLMAKQLTQSMISQEEQIKVEDITIDFSFFTAGSGGAGATLLVATFLILAEKALQIKNGRRVPVKPMQDYTTVNFGSVIGNKDIAPLNLLETASVHDTLGVGSVKSLFGTDPPFWNSLLGFMVKIIPSDVLANEPLMEKLAIFSLPIVRIVDYFAGATNAMRCDISYNNLKGTMIYGHENLEPCVGECVVAFCAAVLTPNKVMPGIWFPEESIDGGEDAASVLGLASVGAHTVDVFGNLDFVGEDLWGRK